MNLMKKAGWQTEFWKILEEESKEAFAWGTHDCVTLCMRVIALSEDISSRVRETFGEWSSAADALNATNGDLDAAVRSVLGEPAPWTRLSQGDIAIGIDDEQREFLCVHDGCQFIARKVDHGLQRVPFAMIRHGWRIS